MSRANNILKNILCLTIAFLVSFMEMQFFDGDGNLIINIMILLLTVPTIYLYFLPKHETMIIFIYCIVLVYILDYLGKDVNIKLLLLTLFSIVLLFAQSVYTANVKATKNKKPAYLKYLGILILVLLLVTTFSFLIYEYILRPNINDQNKLALVYEPLDQQEEESNQSLENEVNNSSGSGGSGGGGGILDNIDWFKLLKYLLLFILIAILVYLMYKYIKYRIWLNNTLNLPINQQVIEFYKYFLKSLSILGLSKKPSSTALEYLKVLSSKNFPFSKDRFKKLTDSFILAKYSSQVIEQKDYEIILDSFYSISKDIREEIGMKDYLFKYLIKL